jgi:hypothetical protein
MSSLVYLLRHPDHLLSRSLYVPDDSGVVSLGIDGTVDGEPPFRAARVLRSGTSCSSKEGESLTYGQLVEVLVQAKKVITI